MASSNKFAGLPGFAHGEPDVYETVGSSTSGDKPPEVLTDMSENENIERIGINAGESFSQFKGKSVPARADFSDAVGRHRTVGYTNDGQQWESNGEGLLDETLQDRFERIQNDIRSLEMDYSAISAQEQRNDSFAAQNAVDFSEKIDQLKAGFHAVNAKSLSAKPRQILPRETGAGDRSQNIVESSSSDTLAQAVALEQRLRKLEQAFGSEKDLAALASDSSSSLMAAVTMLKTQMSLLNKDNLDQIEARMQSVLPRLTQAVDRQTHASDAELEKKIIDAYALLKRWEETMNSLPAVVDRLVVLKAVHEQASSFVQLQQEVEELQKQLLDKIAIMEGNIRLTEESFAQNMNIIKKNMEHLEARCKGGK